MITKRAATEKRAAAVFSLALGILAANSALAGPLTGQTLGASGGFNPIAPPTAVVTDPTVEFIDTILGALHFDINFFESGLVVVTWRGAGGLGHGGGDLQTYTDINSTIDAIIGFNLVSTSGVTGIAQSDLSFNANSVTMQIGSGTAWSDGNSFTAQIVFAPVQVPEPATLALLGLGLAGLGFSRRKQ